MFAQKGCLSLNRDTVRQLNLSDFEQGSRRQKYFLFEVTVYAACRKNDFFTAGYSYNTDEQQDDAPKRHIV